MQKDRKEICVWQLDNAMFWQEYDDYRSACGSLFRFASGGPQENNFAFCPYCGKPISEGSR